MREAHYGVVAEEYIHFVADDMRCVASNCLRRYLNQKGHQQKYQRKKKQKKVEASVRDENKEAIQQKRMSQKRNDNNKNILLGLAKFQIQNY